VCFAHTRRQTLERSTSRLHKVTHLRHIALNHRFGNSGSKQTLQCSEGCARAFDAQDAFAKPDTRPFAKLHRHATVVNVDEIRRDKRLRKRCIEIGWQPKSAQRSLALSVA